MATRTGLTFAAALLDRGRGAETLAYHDVAPASTALPASTGDRLMGALFLGRRAGRRIARLGLRADSSRTIRASARAWR